MGDMEVPGPGRDLNRVVDMLRSARMEDKFRQLRADNLLAELRSAVSLVHAGGEAVSKDVSLRLTFSVRSLGLATSLRELLEAVLNMQTSSADEWHQVPAALYRYRVFRSNTLHDLREFLDKFRALVPYVRLNDAPYMSWHISSSASYDIRARDSHDRYRDAILEPMVGRSELVDKMVRILLADTASEGGLCVVTVVGGPGVGKSRLAKAILHDDRVKHKFCVRLAVPVTQDFSCKRISMKMVFPQRHVDVQTSPEAMADHISAKLNGGDYLIVLDDVWSDNEEKWHQVGAVMKALPPSGRVVLTTRTPDIISKLATIVEITDTKPFYLKPLELEFTSWFVARWMATYCGDWPAELIRKAGMKIAEKCGGMPLLLDFVRQFFCQPQGLRFWKGLLENTGNNINPDMFWPHLLAHIDHLPTDKFWQQFLWFS